MTVLEKDTALERKQRRSDAITDADYLADLADLDTSEIRSRRQTCTDVDRELSYYRRLLHGRIDLLDFEQRRRTGTEHRSLVEALPDILGDASSPGAGTGHVTVDAGDPTPPDIPVSGSRQIDFVLGDDFLSHISELDDAALATTRQRLADAETEVSQQRRVVHGALDALSDELTRRYRSGATSVDDLLRG